MGGGSSTSTASYKIFDTRPYIADNLTKLEDTISSQVIPIAANYGSDVQKASDQATQYGNIAMNAMNNANNLSLSNNIDDETAAGLTRDYSRTAGSILNSLAGKGIINSSVAASNLNSAAANVADSIYKNKIDAYNAQSSNLNNIANAANTAKSSLYTDLANKYSGVSDFYKQYSTNEDNRTVVVQDEATTTSGK